jgi:hypothetical protein
MYCAIQIKPPNNNRYFENGGEKFEQLRKSWGVLDVGGLKSKARDAGLISRDED